MGNTVSDKYADESDSFMGELRDRRFLLAARVLISMSSGTMNKINNPHLEKYGNGLPRYTFFTERFLNVVLRSVWF